MANSTIQSPIYVFAFFPYLRTSGQIRYRGLCLKNSDDETGVPEEVRDHFALLKNLFFLRDNYRIKHTTYTLLTVPTESAIQKSLDPLLEFQTLAAYLYSAPRSNFNDTFLSSEHATLYCFVPKRMFKTLIVQEWEVDALPGSDYPAADDRDEIPAYETYINGKVVTWVAQGTRLYPPTPRIVMTHSQDLVHQFEQAAYSPRHNPVLAYFSEFRRNDPRRDEQLFTALRWYNRANSDDADDQLSIMYLSIGFEALLNLPGEDHVTRRFTEAVTLLLGRLPRLESWAQQFYNARSDIVHKGSSDRLQFLAADDHRKARPEHAYKPLVAYGRQIFQLCVSTIITGAVLADQAKLSNQLSTNAERFERIVKTLNDPGNPQDLIAATADDLADIQEYRYLGEANLTYRAIIGAARAMTRQYLQTTASETEALMIAMNDLCKATEEFDQLDAIRRINDELKPHPGPAHGEARRILHSLIDAVWHYSFMYYFHLERGRRAARTDQ